MVTSMISNEVLFSIGIGIVSGVAISFLLFMFMRSRATRSVYEHARAESDEHVKRIVNEAQEEGRKIFETARASAQAFSNSQQSESVERAKLYQKTLENLAMDARHVIEGGTVKALAAQAEMTERFLKEVSQQGAGAKAHIDQLQKGIEELFVAIQAQTSDIRRRLDEGGQGAIAGLDKALQDLAEGLKKRSDEHFSVLLASAEKDVAQYREGMRRLIDERMADLVAETSRVVLRKALKPEEHADLVENALKEAKSAGMI